MKINRLSSLAVLLALCLGATPALAGGVDFSPDDVGADAGAPYLGIVTDQSGAPVPDVKVTVVLAKLNATIVVRADSLGHFFIQGFDKSVHPDDVKITCAKEGYTDADATKAPTTDPGADASAPIQVVCVLSKAG